MSDWQQAQACVPQAMRDRVQWLFFRFEQHEGEKKPRKVPYYLNGKRRMGVQGSPEDRAALCTFDQVSAPLGRKRFDGAGFAFLPGDGLIGIDIDRAIDTETGEVAEHCREIIERCASYTELSPSGTGVHIIVEGETKTFKSNEVGVEVFCGRQFFTVTGAHWAGSPAQVSAIGADTLGWLHGLVKGAAQAPAAVQAPAPAMPSAGPVRDAARDATRYCMAALESGVQRMRSAGEGKRNDTLNTEAYGLAQLVHTGGISEIVIRSTLADAARACGLADAEIMQTMGSGIRAGLMAPRDLPVRERPALRSVPTRAPAPAAAQQADEQEPPWVAEDGPSSPPPSGDEAPHAPTRGKGAARKRSSKASAPKQREADGDDERDEFFWQRVDVLTERFTLIEASDTAWDRKLQLIYRVANMRMRFGTQEVKAWLARIAKDSVATVLPTDLVFEPGQAVGAHQINMFGGLTLQPTPCTAADVEPMLNLLRHLCSETSSSADDVDAVLHWILCWQALPLQQLGVKMQTACVFHGAQGTGKNLYWDAWRDLFGDYGISVSQTELEDKFNGWVSRKLAIVGDEVVSRQEMYHNKNRLKLIVTQETKFPIRGMQQETRWESNHANVVFLSNEPQPLALEERDRRYMVIYTPLEADPALYEAVRVFKANGGLAKWLYYLQHYTLDGFTAHTKPIMTRAKEELIELNWKAPERFAHEWLEHFLDLPVRVCSAEQLYRAFRRWADQQGERWPPSQAIFTRSVERWVKERCKRNASGRLELPALHYKQVALKDAAANRKTVRCWLPVGSLPPSGVSEGEWAYQSVQAFEADVARFCRRPGALGDEA